ncbi:hypothetical protein TNCV_5137831 [Trichonephila clavipes]|nr:hypothetical protein TNCV_5137831 [Trichonephila clavipes]
MLFICQVRARGQTSGTLNIKFIHRRKSSVSRSGKERGQSIGWPYPINLAGYVAFKKQNLLEDVVVSYCVAAEKPNTTPGIFKNGTSYSFAGADKAKKNARPPL